MQENNKRNEILQNALTLFQTKGYDNVTINEIAKASGISKNTFYYYFDSKEQLINDLFFPNEQFTPEQLTALMGINDPLEQYLTLVDFITSYVNNLGRDVTRQALQLNLSQAHPAAPKEKKAIVVMMENMLQRCMEEKKIRIRTDTESLSHFCLFIVLGVLQVWATAPIEFDLTKACRTQLELALRPDSD